MGLGGLQLVLDNTDGWLGQHEHHGSQCHPSPDGRNSGSTGRSSGRYSGRYARWRWTQSRVSLGPQEDHVRHYEETSQDHQDHVSHEWSSWSMPKNWKW